MSSLIRMCAIVAAAFVGLGFMTFAADQSQKGSDNQVQAVDGSQPQKPADNDINRPVPPSAVEHRREKAHSGMREFIDDGNDYLLSPFNFVESDNVWVERMVPAGLGLFVYGFCGLLLANLVPKHRRETRDWREATS